MSSAPQLRATGSLCLLLAVVALYLCVGSGWPLHQQWRGVSLSAISGEGGYDWAADSLNNTAKQLPGNAHRSGSWVATHPAYDLLQSDITLYRQLAHRYLLPWTPLPQQPTFITRRMLDATHHLNAATAIRICIIERKLYYRVLQYLSKSFYTDRANWYLQLLQSMLDAGLLPAHLRVDAVINMKDGPAIGQDTVVGPQSGLPLFALQTSLSHIDIPLPDPVAYGSNGNYVWPEGLINNISFTSRRPKAVFRGSASNFQYHNGNWMASARVKAVQLSQRHPELLDAGITRWNKVDQTRVLYPKSSAADVEANTNITLSTAMSFRDQAMYKYHLDIDGAVGSSRKVNILLRSGSVLLAQRTSNYRYADPLLVDGVHLLAVEPQFGNLISQIQFLQQHDEHAQMVARNGQQFAQRFFSMDAVKLYLSVVLEEYSHLLAGPVSLTSIEQVECSAAAKDGPMHCSKSWLEWTGQKIARQAPKQ